VGPPSNIQGCDGLLSSPLPFMLPTRTKIQQISMFTNGHKRNSTQLTTLSLLGCDIDGVTLCFEKVFPATSNTHPSTFAKKTIKRQKRDLNGTNKGGTPHQNHTPLYFTKNDVKQQQPAPPNSCETNTEILNNKWPLGTKWEGHLRNIVEVISSLLAPQVVCHRKQSIPADTMRCDGNLLVVFHKRLLFSLTRPSGPASRARMELA
jgi:hypothetical protein